MNTVAPGTIRTPMYGDNTDQSGGLHLLNRVGEVEDIAQMIYTVAKSNFIAGAIMNVDGGTGARHNLNGCENPLINRFYTLHFAGYKNTKFKENEY